MFDYVFATRQVKHNHPGKWAVSYVADGEPIRQEITITKEMFQDYAFRVAAKIAAYDDIYDANNIRVHHAGRTYHYVGWQPGMKIEFANEIGVSVWCDYLYECDH